MFTVIDSSPWNRFRSRSPRDYGPLGTSLSRCLRSEIGARFSPSFTRFLRPVFDATLDSDVGTLPVQCRHATTPSSELPTPRETSVRQWNATFGTFYADTLRWPSALVAGYRVYRFAGLLKLPPASYSNVECVAAHRKSTVIGGDGIRCWRG